MWRVLAMTVVRQLLPVGLTLTGLIILQRIALLLLARWPSG
jgi:hypothetical protein